MVKPIDLDELFLRIGALLRRAKIAGSHRLEIGRLTLHADERTAILDGEEISLTAREFNILGLALVKRVAEAAVKVSKKPNSGFARSNFFGEKN